MTGISRGSLPRPSGRAAALAGLLLLGVVARARAAPPSARAAVHHDVLPRLAAVASRQALSGVADRGREAGRESEREERLPTGLRGTAALATGGLLEGVFAPPLGLALESLSDTANPADSMGDVGPRHYFQIANGGFTIWDKQGHRLLISEYLPTLWAGFGGLCEEFAGDPAVIYDARADRWIVAVMSTRNAETGPWLECVALSQSGDPLGAWDRWAWSFDRLNDFPKLAVWGDAYYFTINGIPPPHAVIALERARMLAGDPAARRIQLDIDQATWGVHNLVLPADLEGSRTPPAGAALPVVGVKQDFPGGPGRLLDVLEAHVDWAHPETSHFTRAASFPLTPGDAYRHGPYQRAVYRNFGAFETLATTAKVYADQIDLEWYQLRRRPGGSWSMWQQGTYNPDTGWEMTPTAAMDGAGNLGLVWQKTNEAVSVPPNERTPSVEYSGRQPGDPAGLLREPRSLAASLAADGSGRFGDYASIVVDPSDDCTFWMTGEYLTPGNLFSRVNIRIGTFKFPNCPDAAAPDTRLDSAPGPGSGGEVQFVFGSTEPGSMFDCALDDLVFAPCTSPRAFSALGAARHTFRVRAIDSAGNIDPTPAAWTWRVGEVVACVPSATELCIDGQPGDRRYRVTVAFATAQGGGRLGDGHAIALAPIGAARGGLFSFFDAANPEMLVKVLDGTQGFAWFFDSAATNVGFTATVEDTFTGRRNTYTNADRHPALAVQDTSAFPPDGGQGPPYTPVATAFDAAHDLATGTLAPTPCVTSASVLCIDRLPGDRRFKVELVYATSQAGGLSGSGHAVPLAPLGVTRGGLFWFFDASNPEALVKILDACTAGKMWVFYSAGTNVGFDLKVTDTVTGAWRNYHHADRTVAPPVQDTAAFPCTP